MNPAINKHNTGGCFLIQPIGENPIFTREQFSDEHREIKQMVREFAGEGILENKKEIEKLKADLARAKEDHQFDNLVHKKELEEINKK
mgnify:CR=1 FL=1